MPGKTDKEKGRIFSEELQQNAEAPFSTDEITEMRFNISPGAPPQGPQAGQREPSKAATTTYWLLVATFSFTVVALFVVLMASTIMRFLNTDLQPSQNYTPPTEETLAIFEGDAGSLLTDASALSAAQLAYLVGPCVTGVRGYERGNPEPAFYGSGVVLDARGYIATVCADMQSYSSIGVTLQDGTVHIARLVGMDQVSGLCVLKIEEENLVVPSFKTGDDTLLGEQAVIIYNPGGSGTLVSQGIVRGLNSPDTVFSDATVFSYIQTDTPVQSSGGALVNPSGHITGFCTQTAGWVIPFSQAKPILDSILTGEDTAGNHALLGAYVRPLNAATAAATGLPSQGLYIANVTTYSPLPAVGIYPGATILTADGRTMATAQDLLEVLASHRPGDKLTLEIFLFQTGETIKVTCVLAGTSEIFIFRSDDLQATV
ncbi:S1C family serine protease [Ruminococcaceae bacterium OttesenSCG-928-N02]|nr:S1C family serine protease [Ruminococcaceae bacterium OttesenSCG-928-N02]